MKNTQADYISSFLVSELYNGLPQHESWIQNIVVPKNAFGVFVTVERNKKVHGCIGNWREDYRNISSRDDAIKMMVDVAKSAVFRDSRSKFLGPILEDPDSIFRVSWMINPVYHADSKTGYIEKLGRYFDNNDMGIIVFSGLKRATYLPRVFESGSWKEIKTSLINKAELNTRNSPLFISYFTKEIEFPFFKSFTGYSFCDPYVQFILNFTKINKKIPYLVSRKGVIFSKDDERVRNLAVIEGIRNLICYGDHLQIESQSVDFYLKDILDTFHSPLKKSARQALTSAIEIISNEDKPICEYLFSQIDDLEPDFERQQVFIALLRKCRNIRGIEISEELIHNIFSEPVEKSIFRLNWEIQLLFESIKIWKSMTKYITILDKSISNIIRYFNKDTMTNELAVAFEGTSYLKYINKEITDLPLYSDKYLMDIVLLLWKRWNPKYGLFMFKDGEARIDITNHVLNAQRILHSIKFSSE
jgi:AMMECR1 domain-containing protein